MNTSIDKYWKKFLGIETYKINYYYKLILYKLFGYKFPKLQSQQRYWADRGQVYMEEIITSGYLDREIFFQDMLISRLRKTNFTSFFEAGCGFGWNIRRVKNEFPGTRVGGIDFSLTQLKNSHSYLNNTGIPVINGDNCQMPFMDNSFDVGFSLGVFMNIHPDKINNALKEMKRVCRKYIIHIEYDENHTTTSLKEKRAFKTNIISHDYKTLYQQLGMKVSEFYTHEKFGKAYLSHQKELNTHLDRWEGFEGAEKYIFMVVEIPDKKK